MRWYLVVFSFICLGASGLPEVSAQDAPEPSPTQAPATSPEPAGATKSAPAASKKPATFTRTPSTTAPGTSGIAPGNGIPESLPISNERYRPSGFWTSGRPAQGGAYRYRMLGIGTAIAVVMLGFVLWIVRRDREVPDLPEEAG